MLLQIKDKSQNKAVKATCLVLGLQLAAIQEVGRCGLQMIKNLETVQALQSMHDAQYTYNMCPEECSQQGLCGSAMISRLQCRQPCLHQPNPWHCLAAMHCLGTISKSASKMYWLTRPFRSSGITQCGTASFANWLLTLQAHSVFCMQLKCESHPCKADTAELHLTLGPGADHFGLSI